MSSSFADSSPPNRGGAKDDQNGSDPFEFVGATAFDDAVFQFIKTTHRDDRKWLVSDNYSLSFKLWPTSAAAAPPRAAKPLPAPVPTPVPTPAVAPTLGPPISRRGTTMQVAETPIPTVTMQVAETPAATPEPATPRPTVSRPWLAPPPRSPVASSPGGTSVGDQIEVTSEMLQWDKSSEKSVQDQLKMAFDEAAKRRKPPDESAEDVEEPTTPSPPTFSVEIGQEKATSMNSSSAASAAVKRESLSTSASTEDQRRVEFLELGGRDTHRRLSFKIGEYPEVEKFSSKPGEITSTKVLH